MLQVLAFRRGRVTFSSGDGGNLTVNASDVQLIGMGNNSQFDTALFARVAEGATGDGGNLEVNTNTLSIKDEAKISVESLGMGNAGIITLNARSIDLENNALVNASTKNASTQSLDSNNEQATINIDARDLILRRGSNISTNAEGENVQGGNINIDSSVSVALEISDITANSALGRGGNVTIFSQGIFGTQWRENITTDSDITASSEFGINGTVQINNVGIEPSSGLVELPELINTDVVIANSCVARSNQQDSTFYITGKAGFPYVPGEAVPSDYSMFEVRELSDDSSSKTSASPQIKKADSIMGATGIYRLENGELFIGRECEK